MKKERRTGGNKEEEGTSREGKKEEDEAEERRRRRRKQIYNTEVNDAFPMIHLGFLIALEGSTRDYGVDCKDCKDDSERICLSGSSSQRLNF